jgi:ribonucleoside-triphosphate reductase
MSPTYSVCKNHGYLTGEQFVCPICGEKTEVYSRITGYYRPVQNWNAGKTQEFKERKEYVIAHSHLKHNGPKVTEINSEEPAAAQASQASGEELPILFISATCPNCKIARTFMDKMGYQYKALLATENAELARSYGVKQAPTLVLPDGSKFAGAGAIKAYVSKIA